LQPEVFVLLPSRTVLPTSTFPLEALDVVEDEEDELPFSH